MTARQFEKKVSSVLRKYEKYNVTGYKVWRENSQIYLSVRLGPDLFREQPWGVSGVFDRTGRLIKSGYGSRRDYMLARILMKRIEEACEDESKRAK